MARQGGEPPQAGQLVLLRQRPGLIRDVMAQEPRSDEPCTLVQVEYVDGWGHPEEDRVLWEREVGARIISSLTLPRIDAAQRRPDPPPRLQSFLDALTWSSLNRLTADGEEVLLCSPWHSAVRVEAYQLHPVWKALEMPRIALLLADDVGLGKTIEAGLIATELVLRRRIRRMLILCPAALQLQWREEMGSKFHLDFTILDREEMLRQQRELGADANPWASLPRIIASMDYLRQPDVLERFRASLRRLSKDNPARLPWDLLVVDEAHNLLPANLGRDSQRCEMLREISLYFEHRLFLTATPHNGYTRAFTGLLELLDPVRFQQKSELAAADHAQLRLTVVRRLKSELNAAALTPRFAPRQVEAVTFHLDPAEGRLAHALQGYRRAILAGLDPLERKERKLGYFLLTLLYKRLLSTSYAFARTWWSLREGASRGRRELAEALHAQEQAETPVPDDAEKTLRELDAARLGGGWLTKFGNELEAAAQAVDLALEKLGWRREVVGGGDWEGLVPPPDGRWEALQGWIEGHLREGAGFKPDERLILFTEYKDTLDYLLWRFRLLGIAEPQLRFLFGGSSLAEREVVKTAFNDPEAPLRILLATDVASEGLNLQESCRYVLHQEIPWNPMRLEQRNGRVDRYGQRRAVRIYHFHSEEDADLAFLHRVVRKVEQVREDLGSVGQVLDDAVLGHFLGEQVDEAELERRVAQAQGQAAGQRDLVGCDVGQDAAYQAQTQRLEAAQLRLGVSPARLQQLFQEAVRLAGGELREDPAGGCRLQRTPSAWRGLVEETLALKDKVRRGALPRLVFGPESTEEPWGRGVPQDTVWLRLGHPLMRRALNELRRHLWDEEMARWSLMEAPLPRSMDMLLVLHGLLTASNALHETLHEEVIAFPFLAGAELSPMERALWEQLQPLPRTALGAAPLARWEARLRQHWAGYADTLRAFLERERRKREERLHSLVEAARERELRRRRRAYQERLRELQVLAPEREVARVRREYERAAAQERQLTFRPEDRSALEERVRHLERRLAELAGDEAVQARQRQRERLEREERRELDEGLPRRLTLQRVDLQPVAVEVWVWGGALS
ncbi:MAG: DISARM system SNF2-like helicase DrmD [Thermaerobacter sp.]|nr:DISARM system SNF2-like helicase DrmD [Thermaerobacter sp.]